METRADRGRLLPSKLFEKSLRGRLFERFSSDRRDVSSHHHRILFYGDNGGGAISPDVAPIERKHRHPNQSLIGIWTQNLWYYHSDSLVNVVDDYVHQWFREFLVHGTVWTGVCDNAVHRSQRLEAKPLKSSDWPRDPLGPSWPSFPSIPEWMEMIRKGIDPLDRPELSQPEGHLGFTSVSRREISENPYLATLIVSNVVVGIRSTTEIPGKFLKYFRYSHNFLIMVSTWSLPIGLVRFLLAQWCQNPYSLWLRRAVTFRKFLKKVPISLVKRARLGGSRYLRNTPNQSGTFTVSEDLSTDYESDGSSLLD